MKLDYDYLRDVMIAIEEAPFEVNSYYPMELLINSSEKLKQHSEEETFFVLSQLHQAGFVELTLSMPLGADINQLTFEGNNFLNNIRSEKVWKKVLKRVADTTISASIPVISQIAQNEISTLFHLN